MGSPPSGPLKGSFEATHGGWRGRRDSAGLNGSTTRAPDHLGDDSGSIHVPDDVEAFPSGTCPGQRQRVGGRPGRHSWLRNVRRPYCLIDEKNTIPFTMTLIGRKV